MSEITAEEQNFIYDTVETLVKTNLLSCEEAHELDGACYWEGLNTDGGLILYSTDRQACQSNWILLHGFDMLPRGLLVVVYSLAFVYLFFGVAICSDIFVEAIDVMTNITKKVKRKDPRTGEEVEVEEPVWNWVVANITLMACGSSAPEILLAIVEAVIRLNEHPGELGPSTIVGSASYNFFTIQAVCNASLAVGTFKKIVHYRVFATTAIWSIWSHVWMYLVYKIISPGRIEIWEAWLTLAQFPIITLHAFIMDKQPWKRNQVAAELVTAGNSDAESVTSKLGNGDTFEAAQKQRRSILYYRMLAVRQMAGETKTPDMLETLNEGHEHLNVEDGPGFSTFMKRQEDLEAVEQNIPAHATKIAFGSLHYSVLESTGAAKVVVRRYDGDLSQAVSVQYRTKDGTAVAGLDFEGAAGTIHFGPGETEREIVIPIIDDDMSEPDVTFTMLLSGAVGEAVYIVQPTVPVTIVDDDDGGMLTFELPTFEAGMKDDYVEVPVVRRNGVDGNVTVEYLTKDGSAQAGTHYSATNGTLEFKSGQSRAYIKVPLLHCTSTTNAVFKLCLTNPLGGAVLGRRTECRIIIVPGSKLQSKDINGRTASGKSGKSGSHGEEEEFELWSAWRNQFKDAIMPDIEAEGAELWIELGLHYISITWKLLLAIIPPAEWMSGVPCFFIALALLVGIVAMLKEIAELWGCTVTLSPLMTGLSLVALGTSLPDTFASRMAAIHDDTADAAIGNITASNSVNVFLGLGVPWVIVTLYKHSKGEHLEVEPGPLGFALVVFCVLCGGGIILMIVRRFYGGELGAGTKRGKILLTLSYLSGWFLFLLLSGLYDYEHIHSDL